MVRLKRTTLLVLLVIITLTLSMSRPVLAAPSVSNITVTEDYHTMRVDFRLTTNGDYQTVVYEEDVVILTANSVAASNSDRWRDWDKGVAMKGLHWAIRLTDNDGITWINGTYEEGAELITFYGISTTNQSIAFHVEATLECGLTVYRDGEHVYSGDIGANFVTIEFVRNGTVGTHTYNITFIQTRFATHEILWQLDHTDIILEELVVPTVTVTVTNTVTIIVTETVTDTQTVTITITETEFVTVTEYVTTTRIVTETIVIVGDTSMATGIGAFLGAGLGVAVVVIAILVRGRASG